MRYQNEEAFAKAWKAGTRHGAYLLWGGENYLIERWANLLQKDEGDASAFNLHRFDGKRPDLDAVYEAVEALPLMAVKKQVYIDDLDWAKLSAPDQKKFSDILADLPEDCVLTVTAKAPGFDPKSAGAKKLIALFDKAGCAVELGSRGQSGQLSFLKSLAKKHGCTLSSDIGRHILDTCEADMNTLSNEMAKICAFAGGGDIAKEHVDAVAIPRTEARVFDLQKMILAGDAAKAMGLLDDLFYLRESTVAILAVLTRAFVDLYRARVARDGGKTTADVAVLFGYKGREFLVRNAFSSCGGLSAGYLRRALNVLFRCDRALKSTGVDDRTLLEQTVVQLFLLDKREA